MPALHIPVIELGFLFQGSRSLSHPNHAPLTSGLNFQPRILIEDTYPSIRRPHLPRLSTDYPPTALKSRDDLVSADATDNFQAFFTAWRSFAKDTRRPLANKSYLCCSSQQSSNLPPQQLAIIIQNVGRSVVIPLRGVDKCRQPLPPGVLHHYVQRSRMVCFSPPLVVHIYIYTS